MKILVLADSLAMPRDENGDVITWDDTWPSLLRKALPHEHEVVNRAERARMITSLNSDAFFQEYIRFLAPDVVIMQIGVVDSMPRVISLREKQLLNMKVRYRYVLPRFIREYFIRSRSKNRKRITVRDPLAKVYTPPDKYRKILNRFIKRSLDTNPSTRFILIPVLIDEAYMEEKSPGATANKNLYNQILAETARASEQVHFLEETRFMGQGTLFCQDGYHLSTEGNRKVAALLHELLTNQP